MFQRKAFSSVTFWCWNQKCVMDTYHIQWKANEILQLIIFYYFWNAAQELIDRISWNFMFNVILTYIDVYQFLVKINQQVVLQSPFSKLFRISYTICFYWIKMCKNLYTKYILLETTMIHTTIMGINSSVGGATIPLFSKILMIVLSYILLHG